MHCGPPNQNCWWAMAHPVHHAAPPMMLSKICAAGAMYKNDCPVQRLVPIYLLVGGAVGAYLTISVLVDSACQVKDPDREWPLLTRTCKCNECIVFVFMVVWFIFGERVFSLAIVCYTVFRKKHPFTFYFISPWKMLRFTQNFQGIFTRN